MNIKVKKLHSDAVVPAYQSAGAACFDLHAIGCNDSKLILGGPRIFRTGLAFEIPPWFVMLVFSRSGQGFNNSVRLANCVGVIDSDYRGEVMVKLARDYSDDPAYLVGPGDRIAQAMVLPVQQVVLTEAAELSETERGSGGFGSTGQSDLDRDGLTAVDLIGGDS